MRDTDLLERALSDLRPIIRAKKWYRPLKINALNIGFIYCWRLFTIFSSEHVPQKDYRCHVVRILIRSLHLVWK